MGQPHIDRGGTATAWLDALFVDIVEGDGREEKALDLESFLAFLERGSCPRSPSSPPQSPVSSSSSSFSSLPLLPPALERKPFSTASSAPVASSLMLIPSPCSSPLSTTSSSLPLYPRWQKREFTHHVHEVEYVTIDKDGKKESLFEKEVTGKEVLHVEWEGGSERGREDGRKGGGGGGGGGWGGGGTAHREKIEYAFKEVMDGEVVVEEECGKEEYVHLARRRERGRHERGMEGEEEEEEEEWERMESSLPARYFEKEKGGRGGGGGGGGEEEGRGGGGGEDRPEEQEQEEGGFQQGER
eukprot:evm.model.NODE_35816_length_2463_cov_28.015022.2